MATTQLARSFALVLGLAFLRSAVGWVFHTPLTVPQGHPGSRRLGVMALRVAAPSAADIAGLVDEGVAVAGEEERAATARRLEAEAAAVPEVVASLVRELESMDLDHDKVDLLVDRLERAYTPIHTIGFLNLGVAGEWDFRYTTSNLPGHDPRKLRLRSVAQRVAPGEEKVQAGKLTNTIAWELVEEGASGTMEIKCDYMVTPKGDLHLDLTEHVLTPVNGSPADPMQLCGMLQRAVPPEVFMPEELDVHITYMDADIRVVECTSRKYGTSKNIYSRKV